MKHEHLGEISGVGVLGATREGAALRAFSNTKKRLKGKVHANKRWGSGAGGPVFPYRPSTPTPLSLPLQRTQAIWRMLYSRRTILFLIFLGEVPLRQVHGSSSSSLLSWWYVVLGGCGREQRTVHTLGYYARAASAAIGRIRVHTGVRRAKGLFDPVHIFDHVVTRGAHFHGLFVLQFLRLQATHIGVHFRELGFHSLLGQARKLLSSPSYEMVRRLGWSMWHTATHRRWYPRPCGDTKGGSYSCCGRRSGGFIS